MMKELEVTDKPHKNDDLCIQQTQEVRDSADTGFSSAQDQKRLGVSTSGKPMIRTATGTEKPRSLDDPSTGVSHEGRDISYQVSCVALRPVEYEADGNISTTSLHHSSGEVVGDAPTVNPSCSQMPCSDASMQSGVGVNSATCAWCFVLRGTRPFRTRLQL